jgi:hypothetical protein
MKAGLVLAALTVGAAACLSSASADTRTCYAISGHGPCLTKAASARKHHHPVRRHSRYIRHRNYAYSDAAPVMTAPLPPLMPEQPQMMNYGPPPPMPMAPVYNFYGPTQNFFGPTTNYFGPQAAYPESYPPPPDDGRMDPWRGYDHRDGLRNGY